LVKPAGYETDGSILQLVDYVARGKALEWTADRDDGTFGITPDGCRVTLSFEDGNNPRTVHLGGMAEGGIYGSVDGDRAVFIAGKGLETLMRDIYVSRATLAMKDVDKMTAKIDGKPAALVSPQEMDLFHAERVLSLGSSDVGAVAIEITVTSAEGGAP